MSCGFDNVDRRLCEVFGELKLGKKQLETLPSDASGLVDSEFNTRISQQLNILQRSPVVILTATQRGGRPVGGEVVFVPLCSLGDYRIRFRPLRNLESMESSY